MKALIRLVSMFALISLPLVAAGEEDAVFSQAELDQMLAPIALYPDSLLAQILTASTYPLEVVEAARWSRDNPALEGTEAVDAVEERQWDPSVKALTAFPQVLERMDEDLDWTKRLGDAVLVQEEEVMSSIQGLREKAYAAGSLESLENVTVRREREVIYIEPANPRIVYVPYYRPTVVYGPWWWSAYPPVYWGPPATVYYSSGTRIIWTSGIHISTGFFYSRPDWHRRHIVVHHHHHHAPSSHYQRSPQDWSKYSSGDRWQHEPAHRRGVKYRHDNLNERFGRSAASTVRERSESDRRSIRYAPNHINREHRSPTASHRSRDRADSVAERLSGSRPGSVESRLSPDRSSADPARTRGFESSRSDFGREKPAAASVPTRCSETSSRRTFSVPSGTERAKPHSFEARKERISSATRNDRSTTRSSKARPAAPQGRERAPAAQSRERPQGKSQWSSPASSRERGSQVRSQEASSSRGNPSAARQSGRPAAGSGGSENSNRGRKSR